MSKLTRTRLAIAATLMAAVSITTVGAVAVSPDAAFRGGDRWCC